MFLISITQWTWAIASPYLLALFSDSGPDEDDERLMAWLDFSSCKSCFVGLFHKDCAGCGSR